LNVVWDNELPNDAPGGTSRVVRIWDGATRVTHWLLVLLLGASWWTASHHNMDYHRFSGYALLGVVIFRVYWGVFGSATARFSQFVRGPRSIWRYLRSGARHAAPGHNPLGALSVLVLLGLILVQVALGLFCVDVDGLESGPLSHWVSFEAGRACAHRHAMVFEALQLLVLLHVVAILFHWIIKRDNLIRPMITGRKGWVHGPVPDINFVPVWRAVLGVVLTVLLVWSLT
jgi:cytochrome b